MSKRTYSCNLPFQHLATRPDGQIYPCCNFRHEETPADLNVKYDDPFYHPFFVSLRKKMLNDEYVSGCSSCYNAEIVSGSSLRTNVNSSEIYRLTKKNKEHNPLLTSIDLAFSNVCNNRCRMCGPDLSTNWYRDAEKFGPLTSNIKRKGVLSKNTILEHCDLTKLRHIRILGGEPLMEEQKLIELLEKCNRSKLEILINTNTTIRPYGRLFQLLKELKAVYFMLSVDAVGVLNNFLRKGSNWQEVDSNIKWFVNEFGSNVIIHSVISIYNVNLFNNLTDYCKELGVWHEFALVDGPKWMMPRNLPVKIKNCLIKRYKDNTDIACKLVISELNKNGNIEIFKDADTQLNKIRKESWRDLNPWLYDKIYK